MGNCSSNHKPPKPNPYSPREPPSSEPLSAESPTPNSPERVVVGKKSNFFGFTTPSPALHFFSKKSPALPPTSEPRSANSTPGKIYKRLFRPPPSPAKHIKALFLRRHGRNNTSTIPEGAEAGAAASATAELDRSFGFSKQFTSKYKIGDEVGRGHFGYTCSALAKKGELKGQKVAVKVIPKDKVLLFFFLVDAFLSQSEVFVSPLVSNVAPGLFFFKIHFYIF